MPSYDSWDSYRTHVQGGMREGNFMSGQFVLVCAGPPFFNQLGFKSGASGDAGTPTLVFPFLLARTSRSVESLRSAAIVRIS
jgi:hypothetical protein